MSEVVPIRPGQSVGIDAVRELCAYAVENIEQFACDGDEPVAIAIFLMGTKNSVGGVAWSRDERDTPFSIYSQAAMIFENRAHLEINRATLPE